MSKNRFHPAERAQTHIIVLAWKDGARTPATVKRIASEVTCGKFRFTQDPQDPDVYNQA